MERPGFSAMLYRRRRELGISIEQAARALRLKEQVLVAFEDGDWANMPKSGYAQGMLASYARYLNLNPREVTNQFTKDLSHYQNGRGQEDHRLRGPDSTGVHSVQLTGRGTPGGAYSGAPGLLPTAGGYAGDMAGFSTVTPVRSRSSYRSQSSYGAERDDYDDYDQRRYTTRQPSAGRPSSGRGYSRSQGSGSVRVEGYGDSNQEERPTRQVRQRSGYRPRVPVRDQGWQSGSGSSTRSSGRDRVTTRAVQSSDYIDDLRYDDPADPYQAASSRTVQASYHNIAPAQRPNVRRRQSSSQRGGGNRRDGRSGGGLMGGNSRALFLIGAVTFAVLMAILIFSATTCVANSTSTGRESSNVAVSTSSTNSGSAATGSSANSTSTTKPAQTTTTTSATTTTTDETKVEVVVTMAEEGISWVEITNDGETVLAETKTGPWTATYNVTKSMKIEVSDPSVVTVTRNGKTMTFESKASGVGSLTIDGPANPEGATESQDGTQAQNGEGTDGSTTDSQATTNGKYQVLQDNGDGSWYDENWYYHDGNGGYYDDYGEYHSE